MSENVWPTLAQTLARGDSAILLQVLESEGSSPGRQGFKMMVGPGEEMAGSIGGGIMEHKMVEKARDMLKKGDSHYFIKAQIHRKDVARDQSGMICSGRQRIVLFPLSPSDEPTVSQISTAFEKSTRETFRLSPNGLHFHPQNTPPKPFSFSYTSDEAWEYEEQCGHKDTVHIIGGGHVGLATSRQFALLDFHVKCYDDRPGLNTMTANTWAHECIVTPYPELGDHIPAGPNEYVLIMTFGYRGDDAAMRALLLKDFRYLGMMGSQAKVNKLLADLRRDGFSEDEIARVHTPIG
ncbi:MAG: XdhC family protein, partial [Bacteroidota bacterium]